MANVIDMSVEAWAAIPDNPRQRDTERRARWSANRHLAKYSKTHDFVYAATKGGEIICKIDGHTRSYLWERGELDLPPSGRVTVLLVSVASLREAKEVYDMLDAQPAYKRPEDQIFGSTREHKFRLRSTLLYRCRFSVQLALAESGDFHCDRYETVPKWKKELLDLDALDLSGAYTVLIAVMLLSIRRDGLETAGPFWTALDKDEGIKDSRGADGVQALAQHMAVRKAEGRTSGYDNLKDIIGRAWYAYEAWLDGKRVKRLGSARISEVIESVHSKRSKQTTK